MSNCRWVDDQTHQYSVIGNPSVLAGVLNVRTIQADLIVIIRAAGLVLIDPQPDEPDIVTLEELERVQPLVRVPEKGDVS